MLGAHQWLLFVHAASVVVWIGSIVAVGVVLGERAVDARIRGALAHRVYRSLAAPAFGFAFLAGVALLAQNPSYYFVRTHFMHAKLPLALGVVGLHHVIGARARRAAAGALAEPAGAKTLAWVTLALSIGAAAAVTLGQAYM